MSEFNRKLQEEFTLLNPYLHTKDCVDLHKMCEICEIYCGKDHNYEECLDKNCFKFYLGYSYLNRITSYEENE